VRWVHLRQSLHACALLATVPLLIKSVVGYLPSRRCLCSTLCVRQFIFLMAEANT
jgi:hypothetical protein